MIYNISESLSLFERILTMQKLKTGAAYHGNRMLSHAISDMNEMARADMDIVVHMLSHTDWERHNKVLGDIFKASEAAGLEVWVDNWGIGGAPGDVSHFLAYHPEAHSYFGNGEMHPFQVCLNAPSYRSFVKNWIEEVASLGGKKIFWDEPLIPDKQVPGSDVFLSACACPTCRKLFAERYGREMPEIMDAEVAEFRNDTLIDYHAFVSAYAKGSGLESSICLMPHQLSGGINKNVTPQQKMMEISIDRLCSIETVDDIGTDPYWFDDADIAKSGNPYEKVYINSKVCVDVANKYGKKHNIWVQGFAAPRGREDEIITATEAIYDAGARTILSWGFNASESNNYRSENPERSWQMTLEGFRRIKSMERDRLLKENRRKYKK